VNAVFDYLSYGVTLSLLRARCRDEGWPPLHCGVIDTIAAVPILYGLALMLALILALISAPTLMPRVAKRWFFDRINDETSDLATLARTAGFASFIAASLVGLGWIAWHGALWIGTHFDDSALLLLSAVEGTMRWLGFV
jgi:hypothetical protein